MSRSNTTCSMSSATTSRSTFATVALAISSASETSSGWRPRRERRTPARSSGESFSSTLRSRLLWAPRLVRPTGSGLGLRRPSRLGAVEEARPGSGAGAGHYLFEAAHESGFAMVLGADLGHEALPLFAFPGVLVAPPRLPEVHERRVVVLALLRLEDAHAEGAVDLARNARVALGELLSDGLRYVVAYAFELLVGRLAQPIDKPIDLLGLEQEFDQGVQVGTGGGIDGFLVPRGALRLGHVAHEIGIGVRVRVRLEVRPRRVERRVAVPELEQEVALEPAEVMAGERGGTLLLQLEPAFDPREGLCRFPADLKHLGQSETVRWR